MGCQIFFEIYDQQLLDFDFQSVFLQSKFLQSIWTAEKENTITIRLCLCIWTYLTVLGRIGLIYPPVVLTQGCRLESQQ